jgi:transposase
VRLTALFPHWRGLHIMHVRAELDHLTLFAELISRTARCPTCHRASRAVHSRYQRRVADLPCGGRAVTLLIHARRFFCRAPDCSRQTFAERLTMLVAPGARRSHALDAALTQIGAALGGKSGARLARRLAMPTSDDTLLRLVRAMPLSVAAPVHVLGVDDWAWTKGRRYGTIVCDLERHRAVDLLPDRSADSVAAWLRASPGVRVIARDRSDLYADGATRGAPDALHTAQGAPADRFHLLKNLGDALERFLQQKRSKLKQAGMPTVRPPPPRHLQPWEQRREREGEQRHAPWIARYEQVVALHAKGAAIADIARMVGISGTTVYRYLRLGCPPGRRQYNRRRTPLDPYKEHLLRRWEEGCHVATRLWREIRAMGYAHSYTNVSRFLAQLRLPVGQRPSIFREHGTADRAPTPRKIAMLFIRRPANLTDEQRMIVERICAADTTFAHAYTLTQEFAALLRQRRGERLDGWITGASVSEVVELRRFATGLLLDKAAIQAGLTEEWSNGQTEGHVNCLKTLKRQMYGRAGFALLRKRFLYPP